MTAWVRRASGQRPAVPRWNGGRMPLSTTLADAVVQQLALAGEGRFDAPELQCVRPLLEIQQHWSALPTPQTLLAEVLKTREGWHLFLYPVRRPARAPGPGQPDRLARGAARSRAPSRSRSTTTASSCCSATEVDWPALLPQVLRRAGDDATLLHEVLASLNAERAGAAALSRDRARLGPDLPGLPGREAQQQAAAGLVVAVLGGVPQVRPGQPAAAAGRGRNCWRRSSRSAACARAWRAWRRSALVLQRARAADAVRVSADGRALSREAVATRAWPTASRAWWRSWRRPPAARRPSASAAQVRDDAGLRRSRRAGRVAAGAAGRAATRKPSRPLPPL